MSTDTPPEDFPALRAWFEDQGLHEGQYAEARWASLLIDVKKAWADGWAEGFGYDR